MVVIWGNLLSLVGNIAGMWIWVILLDSFFPRKKDKSVHWLFVVIGFLAISVFSVLIGSGFGYTLKMLFEVTLYTTLCAILYQSRWDRRLFVVVTCYAVLYSVSYWTNAVCILLLHLTYEEYVWNIPLYSSVFLSRALMLIVLAVMVRKYHPPLSVDTQARAWVPLSVVFPLSRC